MKKKLIIIAVASLSLTSCSLYKSYQRPDDVKVENTYGTTLQESSEENLATLSWRELYTDPQLQSLIEKALENNTGVKTQEWAVAQAEASLHASKMAYLPSLTLSPSGSYTNVSMDNSRWSYSIPVALDWEIDIFGSLHNQKKMASAALLMQQDLQQAVQARLIATVASNYYQLIALDQTKLLIEEAILTWDDLINAAEAMLQDGEIDAIAVAQFKGQGYEFRTSLTTVEHDIEKAEIALCALLAEPPHAIQRNSIVSCPSSDVLKTGLSSQLLANRPDVRQAERNLEYYYHNERYARAQFFPRFSINAEALYNGSWITSFVGNLVQPIFAKGKINAAHKIAVAEYEQAKLAFQQKLIDAADDVVLAFSQTSAANNRFNTRLLQVEEYKKAVEYSRTLMFNGECTYLDVLTAETKLFEKKYSLIEDQLEEMLGVVNLYLALGGGAE